MTKKLIHRIAVTLYIWFSVECASDVHANGSKAHPVAIATVAISMAITLATVGGGLVHILTSYYLGEYDKWIEKNMDPYLERMWKWFDRRNDS